jgi:hypothetical protein
MSKKKYIWKIEKNLLERKVEEEAKLVRRKKEKRNRKRK